MEDLNDDLLTEILENGAKPVCLLRKSRIFPTVLISISRNYGVIAYNPYTMKQCQADSNLAFVPIIGAMTTSYDQCEGICCGIFRRVCSSFSPGKLKVKDVKDHHKSEEFWDGIYDFKIGYDELH
ncbi:hypothetical protein COLO4_30696 [Corchorus olitorius]|uniref:Uncharacterized protein n=1 Tax=Corchorus olitorius TaxID=93759 RepID=A0A1R3H7M3_9ROSI|nr:hypothetical protein COLO4_30696 [Corchorus olitorius]